MKKPIDMNRHYWTVGCPYCAAPPGEPCRQTMLDARPVADTHRMRVDAAQEVPF